MFHETESKKHFSCVNIRSILYKENNVLANSEISKLDEDFAKK